MCPWGEGVQEGSQDTLLLGKQTESPKTADSLSRSMKMFELASLLSLPTTKATQSTLDNLDLNPISNWLATCDLELEHAACRATPIVWQQLPGISLKVIDVERKCIVEALEPCSFVALTYVWGNTIQPRFTEQTEPVLMQEGGLDRVWPYLPTTIRDAILLCQNLGERYLWVDALCIKQDSIREMKIQIQRMRQIYSAAKFTVAAVSAESADVGLLWKTVSDPLSSGISTCETVEDLEVLLESAPWSSRAWCYQEKVLSHRILMFTSAGVYMHCQRTILTSTGTPLNRRDGTGVGNLDVLQRSHATRQWERGVRANSGQFEERGRGKRALRGVGNFVPASPSASASGPSLYDGAGDAFAAASYAQSC
jgi:hypothetical protein